MDISLVLFWLIFCFDNDSQR